MAPKLNLYLSPGSCALAPHIALYESGLAFTTTHLNVKAGFPAEYLHINAKGKVPVLDIDGEYLTEAPAIISTISALAPQKKLLGSTPMENARALEWMAYLSSTLHAKGWSTVFAPARFVEGDAHVQQAVRAKGVKTVKECYAYIDKVLEGRMYAVGDSFTVVDAYLLVLYRWAGVLRFPMKEDYPNYTRVVEEAVKRDSVKAATEEEGIAPLAEAPVELK